MIYSDFHTEKKEEQYLLCRKCNQVVDILGNEVYTVYYAVTDRPIIRHYEQKCREPLMNEQKLLLEKTKQEMIKQGLI